MRILFLLSCLEPAGSETYCLSLADAWHGKHEVHWISDRLHNDQTYVSMPIHAKAIPLGVINTWRVASYIQAHEIDLVHSHSRRAHWVAAQAAGMRGIPHVTTIHQPLPMHFFSRLFPCLGDQTIAIDEVIATQLRYKFSCSQEKLHLIRNGINLARAMPTVRQAPKVKQILLIGRLSGGRWDTLRFFLGVLERAHRSLPPVNYKILGRVPNEKRAELERLLVVLNGKIGPSTIESLGYVKDLGTVIRNADAAIAAGRSALECMAQGRPVILMGEGGILGLRRPEIWTAAMQTNMGDHLEPKEFVPAKLEVALREVLSPNASEAQMNAWGRLQVEKDYDIRKVAAQVEAVYTQARKS